MLYNDYSMPQNPESFFKKNTAHFFEGLFNIFIFLPHFFSIPYLLKTFFSPWKNLTTAKTTPGFSFSDFFDRLSFNLISRFMGAMLRFFLLLAYLFAAGAYIMLSPLIIASYFLLFPLLYLLNIVREPESARYERLKKTFVASHALKSENTPAVEAWFNEYFNRFFKKQEWWRLEHLLGITPLGRDWTAGYTPQLDTYTTNLSTPSYQSHIGHIVDREKETDQISRALSRTEGGNVLVVGEEGVGKHTIISSLANAMYEGKALPNLSYKRLLTLDMEKILAKNTDQKMREDVVETLFKEAAEAHNIILVIDNIDRYVTSSKDRVDLSLSLEKFAHLPSLHFIGVTTPEMFEKFIVTNEKIVRHFEKVDVYEVTKDQALLILLEYVPRLEGRYALTIPYETITEALDKSEVFIAGLPYPEKVMKLLDEACIATQTKKEKTVTPETIGSVITEKTHIQTSVTEDLRGKLLTLESELSKRVLRQDEAMKKVAEAVSTAFVSIGKRKKPLASLLLLGPTGVGKTQTAKTLAGIIFGSENAMVRFDMSLYQTKEDIEKLTGATNEDTPGLLTAAIREKPFTVLLLDETEKAHHDLLNIFLTILDEGYFTNGQGKRVDVKNTIIVATSNAGSSLFYEHLRETHKNVEDALQTISHDEILNYLIQKNLFTPEFLNRFDAIIAFRPLSRADMKVIGKEMLMGVIQKIKTTHKITVIVPDERLEKFINEHYDPAFGARNLERILASEVEAKVAQLILQRRVGEGGTVQL